MLTPKYPKNQSDGGAGQNSADAKIAKPKKSLGQNFLQDNEAIKGIVDALELKEGDQILEIGPGHGELTKFLIESRAKVIAIEKDVRLIANLAELSKQNSNFKVIEGDALQALEAVVLKEFAKTNKYKICGNIPYYITGYLMRIIGDLDRKPAVAVFTIQKEVAERICAEPGEMNILAASIQVWGKPEIVRIIGRESFFPAPKVDSAVIKITLAEKQMSESLSTKYYSLLKKLFKQPRKTILNNLKASGIESLSQKLDQTNIDPSLRPQDLSIEQIKKLASVF